VRESNTLKKHKLYKLFTQSTYEGFLKSSKKGGYFEFHKDLLKSNCFNLVSLFEKHRRELNTAFIKNSVDLLVYSAEYLWATTGRIVVYPRSASEVSVISKSSFKGMELSMTQGEMMIIASPPDSKLPPLLAGFLYPSLVDKFNRHFSTQVADMESCMGLQESIFIVQFQDSDTRDFLTYTISQSEIPAYAQARTTQEIYELMEGATSAEDGLVVTSEDRLKQAKILKAALNFWLYKVSSPESFVTQTPPVHAREHFGPKPTNTYSLSFADRLGGSKEGNVSEVGIHMRNLRDERYYTNDEWKDKPRGSRWIEIGPYTRGGKGQMIEDDESTIYE
jgi:hypothetical protein